MSDRSSAAEPLWPADSGDVDESRETLDRLLAGFQIISFDWTFLYVNPAAARHGRSTPRELVGRRMMDAYPGFDGMPVFAMLERCMRERRIDTFEIEFTFPDGVRRWFELRVQPVPEGICIYSVDIQQRKEAEQQLADVVGRLKDSTGSGITRLLRALLER